MDEWDYSLEDGPSPGSLNLSIKKLEECHSFVFYTLSLPMD